MPSSRLQARTDSGGCVLVELLVEMLHHRATPSLLRSPRQVDPFARAVCAADYFGTDVALRSETRRKFARLQWRSLQVGVSPELPWMRLCLWFASARQHSEAALSSVGEAVCRCEVVAMLSCGVVIRGGAWLLSC